MVETFVYFPSSCVRTAKIFESTACQSNNHPLANSIYVLIEPQHVISNNVAF